MSYNTIYIIFSPKRNILWNFNLHKHNDADWQGDSPAAAGRDKAIWPLSDKDCFSKPHSNMTINVLKSDNFGYWKCFQIKSISKIIVLPTLKIPMPLNKVIFFQASFENSSSLVISQTAICSLVFWPIRSGIKSDKFCKTTRLKVLSAHWASIVSSHWAHSIAQSEAFV